MCMLHDDHFVCSNLNRKCLIVRCVFLKCSTQNTHIEQLYQAMTSVFIYNLRSSHSTTRKIFKNRRWKLNLVNLFHVSSQVFSRFLYTEIDDHWPWVSNPLYPINFINKRKKNLMKKKYWKNRKMIERSVVSTNVSRKFTIKLGNFCTCVT